MEQNCGGLCLGPLLVIKATRMKSLTKKIMKLWRGPSFERSLARKSRRRPLPLDGETFLLILLNAIGDAIMAQPVWRALKSGRPRVRIALLCRPPIASLLRQDDSLDAIHSFEADPGEWWRPRNVNRIEALWQKRRYEVILDFTEIPVTALACARDTAPPSVGFDRVHDKPGLGKNLSCAYDYSVPYTDSEPIREVMARLASPWIGADFSWRSPSLTVAEQDLKRAASLLEDQGFREGRFVVLHPGAKWAPKRWPILHWSRLIRSIRVDTSWPILLLGGKEDAPLLRDILRNSGNPSVPLLHGEALSTAAGIIKLSALCVCNDSAAMHLAAALGTPSIALFGPVSPSKSAPSPREGCRVLYEELFCSPCTLYYSRDRCRRGVNFCMHALSPERVFREMEDVMGRPEREAS